jgi:hypothetical protein
VGEVTFRALVAAVVTGVEATSGIEGVTIGEGSGVNVSAVGSAGAAAVNSVVATGSTAPITTGLEATGGVGTVTATGIAVVSPVGVAADGLVTSIRQDALVFFEGWGRNSWGAGAWSQPVTLPLEATGQVGEVTTQVNQRIPVTGFEMTSAVGSVSVTTGTGIDVDVTGVSADGLISPWGVLVWGRIVPNPSTGWTPVVPSTTTSYTTINP